MASFARGVMAAACFVPLLLQVSFASALGLFYRSIRFLLIFCALFLS
jgi:hypothetical protein